jgi:hypothetical protein
MKLSLAMCAVLLVALGCDDDSSGPSTRLLTVERDGTGAGSVASAPAGINCGADCTEAYPAATTVVLTATAAAGSNFTGWDAGPGACSSLGPCTVTMNNAMTVTATFATLQTLTVAKAGTGAGTVTSAPAGINCGGDCTEQFNQDDIITLTAAPAAGSSFTGWAGGGCTGTGTCLVALGTATTVTATFTLNPITLTVVRAGNGTGTITSAPAGINCGTDCNEPYTPNTVVTLTATPATGSTFTGWSGAGCAGTGTCVVTVTAAATATATFTLTTQTLTVASAGTGAGTVTSAPAGINCGVDCTEAYNFGTVVTLTASPITGSTFTGWSGSGCSGTGTCVITMNAATTVTATFDLVMEFASAEGSRAPKVRRAYTVMPGTH